MKTLSALLICLLTTAPVYAELYKWVDEKGGVHYSDQPGKGNVKTEKKLDIPSKASDTPAAPSKSWEERNVEFKKRQNATADAEAKQQKDAQEAKTKAENCAKAKTSLQTFESGQRVVTYDSKGERVYLDDAQREKGLNDARKSVADWCNK